MQERRRAASSQMLMFYWTGRFCRALSQSSSADLVSMGREGGADAESHCEELLSKNIRVITLESLSLCHSSSEKAAQRNEEAAKQVGEARSSRHLELLPSDRSATLELHHNFLLKPRSEFFRLH